MSFSFAYKCQKFYTYLRACFGFFLAVILALKSQPKKKNQDKNRYITYRNDKDSNKMLLLGS